MSDVIGVLQRKAIRALYNLPYNALTNNTFKSGNLLKLNDLYNLSICSQLYKYINTENCEIRDKITAHFQIHGHNTRHNRNLVTPRYNRTTSQSSYIYQAITQWNLLPEHIKQCETVHAFKRQLRDMYCGQY